MAQETLSSKIRIIASIFNRSYGYKKEEIAWRILKE